MAVKENRRSVRGKDRRFYNILPAMKYIVQRVWYVIIKVLVCVGWGVSDLNGTWKLIKQMDLI